MEIRQLGEFVELQQGLAINSKSDYLVYREEHPIDAIPLLRIQDTASNSPNKVFIDKTVGKQFLANPDEIIYTRTGQPGIAFRGFRGVVHNNCFKVKIINEELDYDYLFHILNSDFLRKQVFSNANSSMQIDVTHSIFKSLYIPYCDLNKQRKIASALNNIDGLIIENTRIIETLNNKIKDLYVRFFIQKELPKNLIENKKDWKLEPFTKNSLFSLLHPGIDKFDGQKIYLTTSDVEGFDINYNAKTISYFKRESRANMQPKNNSIWFARMKNSIKHISFKQNAELLNESILSTGFCGVLTSDINFEYVWALINSDWFEKVKDKNATGSTQESITDTVLSYIQILIPDDESLLMFHSITKNDLDLFHDLLQENEKLKKYKKDLLNNFMNESIKI